MKKLFTLAFFVLLTIQLWANPWGHRYTTEQSNQNISSDASTSFVVSVEWGEGGWDVGGSMFGYGTTTNGTDWTWVDLPWFEDGSGSNKRCKTTLAIETPGKYYYAYKMVKGGVSTYSFGSDSWAENQTGINATSYLLIGDYSKQDGAWNSTSTWESGSVPSASTDIGIYHDVTLSASSQESKSLSIISGKSLTINVGGQLTTGAITNNAGNSGLIIKSDATGNGSLIFSGSGPDATVERYIAAYTGSQNGWHLISSPMTSFTVTGSDFVPASGDDDLYEYDEVTNMWLNYLDSGIANFAAGEGYLAARKATMTGDFTGTLNSDDITFSNLSKTTGKGEGFHLLGNPYSSAVIWNESSGWIGSNIAATAQVLDVNSGNYLPITTGSVIPATNGFFIEASSGTNSITIKAASRAHDATNNYKSETASNKMLMKISNDANSYSDQCIIGFKQTATEAFDLEFDSHKLYGNATAPQLSSKIDEEVFSTNYVPELTSSYYFNLEFKAGIDANYTINFEGIDSFESDIFMTLVDLKTNTYTDLRNTPTYSFSANTSDDVDRFVIHAFKSALGLDEMENNLLKVYTYQDLVMVQNKTNTAGQMHVYDLSGRKIYESLISNQEQSSYRLACPSGAYIIHIEAGEQNVRETIIIANK